MTEDAEDAPEPAWRVAVRAFLATRLLVFVVAAFAVTATGLERQGFRVSADPLTNLPARFDAGWYGGIAQDGYERTTRFDRQTNVAFFPAFPMLMRVGGYLTGATDRERPPEVRLARSLWTGVAISLACFLGALWYLARLGARWIGGERAGTAVLLLAAYPFAFAFNAPYTEGLFLLCSVAAVYHFDERRWGLAAVWGLAAGLTRPNGFILALPLGLLVLRQLIDRRDWRAALPAMAVASMPVVGMLLFTVYLHAITDVWFAWRESHGAWGRSFDGFTRISAAWQVLQDEGLLRVMMGEPFNTLNALGLLFALAMSWPVYRHLGFPWLVYVLATILPPLFAGGVLSMGRVTSTLFPVFLALGALVPARAVAAWAGGFALLQGLAVMLFFTWRQLY